MNLKKKIRSSWNHPELPNTCLKKDELEFSKKKRFSISLRTYVFSLSSLIIVFSLTFILVKFEFKKTNNETPPTADKIEFGYLDPLELNIPFKELNKVNIDNKSYYNVRGNFTLWFNSLEMNKAKVDYSKVDLGSLIKDIKPVNICISNEEYTLFFTKEDYLIVLYNQIYIMYDLKDADILLESFVSSF